VVRNLYTQDDAQRIFLAYFSGNHKYKTVQKAAPLTSIGRRLEQESI